MTRSNPAPAPVGSLNEIDWDAMYGEFERNGVVIVGGALAPGQCQELIAHHACPERFRARIVMEQHNFGRGDYAYFADPLPPLISALREHLYPPLAAWANAMNELLGSGSPFPGAWCDYAQQCARRGQVKPTPLLLHYVGGGFNCLHRDVYGEEVFPLQALVMLSEPGVDFEGGEFALVENRPRQQSRVTVVAPRRGDLVIFAGAERPVAGRRKPLRATVRHGVSEITRGERWTLGIIFHNAR